ncbi:hypothetical protein ACFQZC_38595 [Streptacidiphilus monticola]
MGCSLTPRKGTAWRSVTALAHGSYSHCTQLLHRLSQEGKFKDLTGALSGIRRLWYLPPGDAYPRAEAFLVVAPATVRDKARPGFEDRWRALTGRQWAHSLPGVERG